MAVTFATAFARLGRLFDFAVAVRAHQATLRSEFEDTMSNYADADRDMVKTITSSIERRIDESGRLVQDLQTDATSTLLEMVDSDTTVARLDTKESTLELIRQMLAAGTPSTVDRPSSGYVSLPTNDKGTAGSLNTGGGMLLLSDMMPWQGLTATNLFFLDWPSIKTETIRAECIRDATSRSTPEGEEVFRVTGARPINSLDEEWPKGSGTNGLVTVASPKRNGGRSPGKNVCTNSDFEDFTSNVPNNWTLVAGTAGTHVFSATAGYNGSDALRFVGDGSTNPNLKQTLRTTAGTLGEINPDRPYSITFWAKYATAKPTGSLIVSVRDSGGTLLSDGITGRQMQALVTSASITTSYAQYSITCFSPIAIPKGSFIDIRFSANVANTSQVFVDDVVIAEMPQLQTGGLAFQILGGTDRYALGDSYTAAITNNSTISDGGMQQEFERFFGIGSRYGLALPSATSPTIADTLIS